MPDFFVFVLVGFVAQMVDGLLGMAYGVITMSILLATGTPPLLANSSVQFSKVITNGTSGIAHWQFGNVDPDLLKKLVATGIVGAIVGALFVTALPAEILTPLISVYLFAMGVRIFFKAIQQHPIKVKAKWYVAPLGLIGGFLNAIGGAGWGPVTTSTLLERGQDPRITIGSVGVAEFFVSGVTFIVLVGHIPFSDLPFDIIAGLMLGGVIASPLAAYLCGRLPARTVMALVSVLIMALSVSIFVSGG